MDRQEDTPSRGSFLLDSHFDSIHLADYERNRQACHLEWTRAADNTFAIRSRTSASPAKTPDPLREQQQKACIAVSRMDGSQRIVLTSASENPCLAKPSSLHVDTSTCCLHEHGIKWQPVAAGARGWAATAFARSWSEACKHLLPSSRTKTPVCPPVMLHLSP